MKKPDFRKIFLKTVPVMCGYVFLGIAFGIVLDNAGYNVFWAFLMSTFIYAGSMQFVMVPLMAAGASPLTLFVTTLFVNSRHLFYGLSFVDSFRQMKSRPYMIFSLSDETYSLLCGCKAEDPQEENKNEWFWIAILDQSYWIIGSVLGALLGEVIPFDMTGIDFSMTALFVVILLEQVLSDPSATWFAALTGSVVGALALLIFGTSNFLLPALLVTVLIISVYTGFRDRKGEQA